MAILSGEACQTILQRPGALAICRCAARERRAAKAGGCPVASGQRSRRTRPEVGWQVPAPLRQSKLADQLYEQILAKIVSGPLPEGGKLPSEGQLCDLFGVSRPVVREALSRLQADGFDILRPTS